MNEWDCFEDLEPLKWNEDEIKLKKIEEKR